MYSIWRCVMWYFSHCKKYCCSWPGTQNFDIIQVVYGKKAQFQVLMPTVIGVEKALQTSLYNNREDLGYRKVKCVIWYICVPFCCPFRHTPRWKQQLLEMKSYKMLLVLKDFAEDWDQFERMCWYLGPQDDRSHPSKKYDRETTASIQDMDQACAYIYKTLCFVFSA